MQLPALLAQPPELPSLPRAVALLMSELNRPQPSLRRLSQLFALDPTLTAHLLQQANAPEHGLARQIHGIAQALALLSLGQVRALVANAAVGASSRAVPGVNLLQFWRYSQHSAKMARALAGLVRLNPLAAYTAGLLHGLGELVLYQGDPGRMLSISTLAGPLDLHRGQLERHILGFGYAQVSAGLAQQWGLPQDVVDALQHHLTPFDNQVYEPLAGVLHLAVWRARVQAAGLGEREAAVTFPGEVGVALGLDIDMVLQQDPIDWLGGAGEPQVPQPFNRSNAQ
ncbi:HDOD domain-containing protein [Melaminivora sp.]